METNQSNFPAVGGMECVTIPAFNISDEEMKAYYLKEAYLTDRHACTPNPYRIRVTEHPFEKAEKDFAIPFQTNSVPVERNND